jgi:glycosyltransferase involved in cell wall biosynthesis
VSRPESWLRRFRADLSRPESPSAGVAESDPNHANLVLEIEARLLETARELKLPVASNSPSTAESSDFEPFISVLIPVHNDERYVRAALESVTKQSYGRWECIVVDDASTDSSWRFIQDAISGDGRFRSIRNPVNLGAGGARNVALDAASGDFVAFLDGDDLLMAESLADRVAALAPHVGDRNIAGSFCGVRFSPETVDLASLAPHYRSHQKPFVDFVTADAEAPFPMTAALVRIERLRAVGGLDPSMRDGGVDWDLWYRILRNGFVFVSSPFQSVVYRQRSGGITRGNPAAHTRAAASLIRAAHESFEPRLLVDPADYPMVEPLGWYRATLAIAERVTRFSSMALADGDMEGMRETLRGLESGTWPLLGRHLDMDSLVARGVARAFGLKAEDIQLAEDGLRPFVEFLQAEIERVTE